jgi:hypothetical protein
MKEGAKIGVAVGAVAGVLALTALTAFVVVKMRRRTASPSRMHRLKEVDSRLSGFSNSDSDTPRIAAGIQMQDISLADPESGNTKMLASSYQPSDGGFFVPSKNTSLAPSRNP